MGKKETNIEYMIHTISNLIKENRETFTKRAKKIALDLLDGNSLTPEQRIDVTNMLITIETRLGKYGEAMMLGKKLQTQEISPKQRKSIDQKLKYAKSLEDMKRGNPTKDNKEVLKSLRDKLYEGNIETSNIKELVDEYAKTTRGCIFIAEACKYFGLKDQGIRCLNGYRSKNADNIGELEKRAMLQATELLKKNVIRFPKEMWREVYAILDKESILEEPGE